MLNPHYAIKNLLHLVATVNTSASLRFLISLPHMRDYAEIKKTLVFFASTSFMTTFYCIKRVKLHIIKC